jgi:hypothetical protein
MAVAQAELFGAPLPPGLSQAPALVTPEEERGPDRRDRRRRADAVPVPRLDRQAAHRLLRLALRLPGCELPPGAGRFRAGRCRCASGAARFAGLDPGDLVQLLLIRYGPGAGIGWHRDRPIFEHVPGLSLGAPATLRLRRRRTGGFDRAALPLAPRSAYHLTGEARHQWEHSIAPMEETRWSITFRSLSAAGRRLGEADPPDRAGSPPIEE